MQTHEFSDSILRDQAAEVRAALQGVTRSQTFSRSRRGRELLSYLVERTLDGRQAEIKAFSIACDVFARDHNFDAENDALVRVQAARLRALLEDYYANEGREDRVRISLPKGAYVPVFQIATESIACETSESGEAAGATAPLAPVSTDWRWMVPTLVLLLVVSGLGLIWWRLEAKSPQFEQVPNDGSISVLATSFNKFSPEVSDRALEVIRSQLLQLTRLSFVTIYSDRAARIEGDVDPIEIARRRGVHYLLEGRVLGDDGALRVNIDLLDVKSGRYVWTQSYDQKTPGGTRTVDELALSVMASLHLVLLKAASNNAQSVNLDDATPWDLFFLGSWVNWQGRNSLAWEKERVDLLRRALKKDPNFGPADAALAGKLAFLANIDPPSDTADIHAQARHFAQQALEMAPDDADVAFNIGLYDWQEGRINDAVTLMRRTLDLAPHHPLARFLVEVIPYTCTAPPAATIERLVEYDARLPPNSSERWVTLTWAAQLYLNNGDYPRAVEYSKRSFAIYHSPDSMYRFAVAMAHSGDAQEAQELMQSQRENWPSLDARHYGEVVIPRRCGGAPLTDTLRRAFLDLVPLEARGVGH